MDIYMIPTADFHQSEYVGEYFKSRSYMSGFTGSAGTLVVTLTEAGLWTDGRYFIQAEQQLAGSTITLYRMSEEGVPTVKEFVEDKLPQGGVIGFDGRVLSSADGAAYAKIAEKKTEQPVRCKRSGKRDLDRQTTASYRESMDFNR